MKYSHIYLLNLELSEIPSSSTYKKVNWHSFQEMVAYFEIYAVKVTQTIFNL